MNLPVSGGVNGIPDLEQLAVELAEAFPNCRVGVVRPWLAKPYVILSRGLFAAVYIIPTDNNVLLHSGLPNNGMTNLLGAFAMSFGRLDRKSMSDEVAQWVCARGIALEPE